MEEPSALDGIGKFLTALASVLARQPRSQPTFQEIAGIEAREVSCSQTLAFFMDPGREHQMGTLALEALSRAGNLGLKFAGPESYEVRSEDPTQNGKKLDIVVQGRGFVLGIENKLNARLNNPLEDYQAHLDDLASESGAQKILVILALRPKALGPDSAESGVKVVSYRDFLTALKAALPRVLDSAVNKYLTLLIDFIRSLENQLQGTRMDTKLYEFFQQNEANAMETFWRLKELEADLMRRMEAVHEACREFASQNWCKLGRPYSTLKNGENGRESRRLWSSMGGTMAFADGKVIGFEVNLFLCEGWEIILWPSSGFDDCCALESWLSGLGIKLETPATKEGPAYFFRSPKDSTDPTFAEDDATCRDKCRELLTKLARATESKTAVA